jgi:hypothetical protein
VRKQSPGSKPTASEFLIAVNRIQISLMIRDPFVAAAFRTAEDDGLVPAFVEIDNPLTLDSGAVSAFSRWRRPERW